MKLAAITIVLLALAILLLGIKVLFVKGGKFPSGHAHDLVEISKNRKKLKS